MNVVPRSTSRLDAWLPALLLFAGTAVFIGAGRHHPKIDSSLGVPGSDEFFRTFAGHVLHTPNWQGMHLMILLGPVLWALASPGVARVLPARASALTDVGRAAMFLGSAMWAIAFVLDGYLGPRYAEALVAAGPGADAGAIRAFQMNAFLMSRLGMISIVMLGIGALSFAVALMFETPVRSWRAVVGAIGIAVGALTLIAAMTGEFAPGPFTSPYWMLIALSFGVWFLLLGTALPGLKRRAE
jgi:hypothetical protein